MKKKLIIIIMIIAVLIITVGVVLNVLFTKEEEIPLESKGTLNGISYELNAIDKMGFDEFPNVYKKDANKGKGYIVDTLNEPNAPYFYIITLGMKSTGGYSVTIIDIKVDKKENVVVTVKEKSPSNDDIVTEAITFPSTTLMLDHSPKSIKIKNTKNEEFKCLNCGE